MRIENWTFRTLRHEQETGDEFEKSYARRGLCSARSELRSFWSFWSVLSAVSVLSLLSTGSICSAASLLSFGSLGSLLSVASTGSVLSFASVSSVLSVGSSNCVLKAGMNCSDRRAPHDITHTWEIRYSANDWDDAASCTAAQYQMDERPDQCDYKTVTCVVNGFSDSACEVRRKGTSTWRELSQKPSFKIKLDNKYTAGVYPCLNGVCPHGATENEWRTKKYTLNNQVIWDGDIDAYHVYRSYIPASLATQVTVALYRDGEFQSNQTYAMVENVNDKAFVEKWFGKDIPFRLYEIESGVSKFERGGDIYKDSTDPTVVDAAPSTLTLDLPEVDRLNMMRYLASSERTMNWDDACGSDNNYYLLHNNVTWYHIPWGVDRAFGETFMSLWVAPHTLCRAANSCLRDAACKAEYGAVLAEMEANEEFRRVHSVSPVTVGVLNVLLPTILTGVLVIGIMCMNE